MTSQLDIFGGAGQRAPLLVVQVGLFGGNERQYACPHCGAWYATVAACRTHLAVCPAAAQR